MSRGGKQAKRRSTKALLRTDYPHKTGSHRNLGKGYTAVPIAERTIIQTPITVSETPPEMPRHCDQPMRLLYTRATPRRWFWACRSTTCRATVSYTPLPTGAKPIASA